MKLSAFTQTSNCALAGVTLQVSLQAACLQSVYTGAAEGVLLFEEGFPHSCQSPSSSMEKQLSRNLLLCGRKHVQASYPAFPSSLRYWFEVENNIRAAGLKPWCHLGVCEKYREASFTKALSTGMSTEFNKAFE